MADVLQLQPDFTSCPLCGWHVSPSILPCGHVFCRKCLRHTLETQRPDPACSLCNGKIPVKGGESVKEMIDALAKDTTLEIMVKEKIARQTKVVCLSCKKKKATRACLDCSEFYCDDCSVAHGRMGVAKDHVQEDLLPRSNNTTTAGEGTVFDHGLFSWSISSRQAENPTASVEDDASSLPADLFFQQLRGSASSRKSGTTEDFLHRQATAYENRVYLLETAAATVDATIAQLLEVKGTLEKQQNVLKKYSEGLFRAEPSVVASAQAMLPRLKCVLSDCRPPPEQSLSTLRQDVNRLVQFYTKPGIPFDPVAVVPSTDFRARPCKTGSDDNLDTEPHISSLVVTLEGRLVMADHANSMIRIADLINVETTIQILKMDSKPWGLALLRNGHVAVTSSERSIYFIKPLRPTAPSTESGGRGGAKGVKEAKGTENSWVKSAGTKGSPTIESQVPTTRRYWGIGVLSGQRKEGDRLVVSCIKDPDGPASIDVLSFDGVLLKTIIDNTKLGSLVSPKYLSLSSETVLISDDTANVLFSVDIETGRVAKVWTHADLISPRQVVTDPKGNSYVASFGGKCILVLTSAGQWRKLVEKKSLLKDGGKMSPCGLCDVSWGIVAAWEDSGGQCWLEGHDLTQ